MSGTFKFDTLSLHAGQMPDPTYGSRAVPIHQTTSYVFDSTEQAAALFNMEIGGHIYSRLSNPTVATLEQRVAALEGGVSCVAMSSGMAALAMTIMSIASGGDHIVYSSQLYGAAINLIKQTLGRYGLESTAVDPTDLDALKAAIKPNTKLFFAEVIGNPGLDILDVPAAAKICDEAGIPLIVDCTFNTPYLMQPLKHGANIVVHSLTKWMGGHGVAIAGAVVDGGNFDWGRQPGKFPTIAGAHYAYGGVNLWEEYGPTALSTRIRSEGMLNFGPALSPQNAFYILQGLETLPLRMEKHMSNTLKLVDFLANHDRIAWVNHPSLSDHPAHDLAQKLLPKGAGSIVTCGVKGGRAGSEAFIQSVNLASHLANVGDAKTLVIHPGSTTHSHLSASEMQAAGLKADMIRISVGLEDFDDIAADFAQALKRASRATGASS